MFLRTIKKFFLPNVKKNLLKGKKIFGGCVAPPPLPPVYLSLVICVEIDLVCQTFLAIKLSVGCRNGNKFMVLKYLFA